MTDEPGPLLDQINVVVRDMEAMTAFYRRVGLEIQDPPGPWDRHHGAAATPEGVDLDLDSAEFATMWNEGWAPDRGGVVIGFRLADRDLVDRTYRDLTGAGYAGQQPPYDAFWGARYAVVEDPNGNAVGLMSPVDAARRAAPPPLPG